MARILNMYDVPNWKTLYEELLQSDKFLPEFRAQFSEAIDQLEKQPQDSVDEIQIQALLAKIPTPGKPN